MRGPSRRKGLRLPWKKVHAEIAEEDGWDVRPSHGGLVRAFFVILLLHVVIVGGIMINGWINQEPPLPVPAVTQDTVPGDAFSGSSDQPESRTPSTPPQTTASTGARSAPAPVNTRREPVRSGDTIDSFARRHKVDEADVRALNRIGPSSGIQVGQWLLVPDVAGNAELASNPADEAARTMEVPVAQAVTVEEPARSTDPVVQTPGQTTATADPPASTGARTHTVQAGETAWGISRKYNVNVNELLRVNGISDPSTLRIGAELKIP